MKFKSHNPIILAPSLLAGRQAALGESLEEAQVADIKWIHLDIMDGHFVPNISFGPSTVKDLRKNSNVFFDVHLMLSNPHLHIQSFIDAGADSITIHVEPNYPIEDTLKTIKDLGCKTGIAINPKTEVRALIPYLEYCDLILIMSVEPGYGGQHFIDTSLDKIRAISKMKTDRGLPFRIEVDGGIHLENARKCVHAGADTLVCGTAFFQAKDKVEFAHTIAAMGESS